MLTTDDKHFKTSGEALLSSLERDETSIWGVSPANVSLDLKADVGTNI